MRHLSLFTGIGALDLAAEAVGYQTVATAEIDPFCRRLLEQRFPEAAHYSDVHNVAGFDVELVSGGFPCQDLSLAGKHAGLNGERSGLWREFIRIIRASKPRHVLVENVPALRNRGLDAILNDLYHAGYNARWDCLPAYMVGAPHIRDRLWIGATRRDKPPIYIWRKVKGYAGPPEDGILTYAGKPVEKFPRAGELVDIMVVENIPISPLRRPPSYYPTPTRADGAGGPGTSGREGGKNLRTAVADIEGNGRLKPEWVEWMMGLPSGWTDPSLPNDALKAHAGFAREPLPRTTAEPWSEKHRAKRIRALGNSLVPAVAELALRRLL